MSTRLDAEQPPNLTSAIRQWLFERRCRIALGERGSAVRRMIEEQRRFDELELHDPERALVVGNDVDARIGRPLRALRQAPACASSIAPAAERSQGRSRRHDIPAPGNRRA